MNESDTRLHKIDPKLRAAGWGTVEDSRRLIDAERCDLLDVLEYIAYATTPMERQQRLYA